MAQQSEVRRFSSACATRSRSEITLGMLRRSNLSEIEPAVDLGVHFERSILSFVPIAP
jgi:hypothetical protein